MKTKTELDPAQARRRATRSLAFTLTEIMVSMTIFIMVISGVVTCHMFGVRMYEITKAKLSASEDARRGLTLLYEEIRSGKIIRIGTGDDASFARITNGLPQIGNAVQIYPTTNQNYHIRYFWDAEDRRLKRKPSDSVSVAVIANFVSNNLVFSAEDFSGNVLTSYDNNRVIGLMLQFYQVQYPVAPIGPGGVFDYYQLRTKITRRALE